MNKTEKFSFAIAGIGIGLSAILFGLFDWDLQTAAYFYRDGRFPLGEKTYWVFLERWGELPGQLAIAISLFLFITSFRNSESKKWRAHSLFFTLVGLLGTGLLVNIIFKGLFGRPRPYETSYFNGMWEFARPFEFGTPGKGRSFVSGHTANAFFFLSLFFVLPKSKRWLGLSFALILGGVMGAQRIISGSHWLSDILMAGFVMLAVSAVLAPISRSKNPKLSWKPLILLAAFALVYGNPIFEEVHYSWSKYSLPNLQGKPVHRMLEETQLKFAKISLEDGDLSLLWQPGNQWESINIEASGFGWPWSKYQQHLNIDPPTGSLKFSQSKRGQIFSLRNSTVASFSHESIEKIEIEIRGGVLLSRAMLKNTIRPVLIFGTAANPDPALFRDFSGHGFLKDGTGKPIVIQYQAKALRLY